METLELFRQQYGVLHDAKVRAFCYREPDNDFWPSVEINIECYQLSDLQPHVLQSVKFNFVGVKAIALNGCYDNLYGISYLFADGHCHFDFSTEYETWRWSRTG